jgi:hypothetical protein
MKHFQWSLIKLLISLSIFLTIERLDFGQSNVIDIHSFVYVLSVTAVVLTILLLGLAKVPVYHLLSFWIGIFIFLKLAVFNQRPFLGGVYTYLTLTEAAFLLLLVYLAYRVAWELWDFQEAVRYVSWADAGQHLLKVEEADAKIRREMMRSRHFHRSLSVVIAQPASQNLEEVTPQLVAEIQQRTAQFYLKAQLAKLIGEQIRVVDIVMEDKENGRFIILCPEIDSQGSNLLTERIYKAVKDQANVDVSFGVASFPDQALTFESLLTRADHHLRQQQNQTSREIKIHPKQEVLPAQS